MTSLMKLFLSSNCKANFLNNSPNEGMFRTANIPLALLYVGKDNSQRKLLL